MTDARNVYDFEVKTYPGNAATAETAVIHTGRQKITADSEYEARRQILRTVHRKKWCVRSIEPAGQN